MKDTLRNIAILYHNGGVKLETCISTIRDDVSFMPSLIKHQADLTGEYVDAVSASPAASIKKSKLIQQIGECILEKNALRELYRHNETKSILTSIKRAERKIREYNDELDKCNNELGCADEIQRKMKSVESITSNPDTAAEILLYAALVLQYADEDAAKLYNQSVFEIDDFYALDELFRYFGIPNHRDMDQMALEVRLTVMDRKYNPPSVRSIPIQSYKVESDSAYRCLLNMAPWYGSVDYSGKDIISIITDNGSIIGMKL